MDWDERIWDKRIWDERLEDRWDEGKFVQMFGGFIQSELSNIAVSEIDSIPVNKGVKQYNTCFFGIFLGGFANPKRTTGIFP